MFCLNRRMYVRPKPVWPDVGIKSCPIFFKSCPKLAIAVWIKTWWVFYSAQKVNKHLGYFWKIFLPRTSKNRRVWSHWLISHSSITLSSQVLDHSLLKADPSKFIAKIFSFSFSSNEVDATRSSNYFTIKKICGELKISLFLYLLSSFSSKWRKKAKNWQKQSTAFWWVV